MANWLVTPAEKVETNEGMRRLECVYDQLMEVKSFAEHPEVRRTAEVDLQE